MKARDVAWVGLGALTALVLLAVGALWFLATGNLFVTTFALPGLCLLGLSFNAVLLIAYRGPFVSGYAKYLLYELALGLVPPALALAGLATWPYLAWTAAAGRRNAQAVLPGIGRDGTPTSHHTSPARPGPLASLAARRLPNCGLRDQVLVLKYGPAIEYT